jgi:hypothetical protein
MDGISDQTPSAARALTTGDAMTSPQSSMSLALSTFIDNLQLHTGSLLIWFVPTVSVYLYMADPSITVILSAIGLFAAYQSLQWGVIVSHTGDKRTINQLISMDPSLEHLYSRKSILSVIFDALFPTTSKPFESMSQKAGKLIAASAQTMITDNIAPAFANRRQEQHQTILADARRVLHSFVLNIPDQTSDRNIDPATQSSPMNSPLSDHTVAMALAATLLPQSPDIDVPDIDVIENARLVLEEISDKSDGSRGTHTTQKTRHLRNIGALAHALQKLTAASRHGIDTGDNIALTTFPPLSDRDINQITRVALIIKNDLAQVFQNNQSRLQQTHIYGVRSPGFLKTPLIRHWLHSPPRKITRPPPQAGLNGIRTNNTRLKNLSILWELPGPPLYWPPTEPTPRAP